MKVQLPHIPNLLACKYSVTNVNNVHNLNEFYFRETINFLSFWLHRFGLRTWRRRKQRLINEGVMMPCSHSGFISTGPGIMNSAYVEQ